MDRDHRTESIAEGVDNSIAGELHAPWAPRWASPWASIDTLPPIPPEEHLVLGKGDVHIWYVYPEHAQDPALLAAYDALMTPEERAKQQRFVFARDRHQYLVTRALVRTVLSRYAPVAPADWRFTRNAYGKPEVSGVHGVPWLRFNLSHTGGLIACAVSASHRALGVDVEDTGRGGDILGVADSVFSPAELDALRSLPAAAQRDRFFAYWTLKEAYIKARGMGLSLPLEQFSMHLERDASIRISFDPRLEDEPGRWQFSLLRVSARHLLALGVRCDDGATPLLNAACQVPLAPVVRPAPERLPARVHASRPEHSESVAWPAAAEAQRADATQMRIAGRESEAP